MQKTAFIAIVGCPNVGKSSILNRLLGQKIAIVSNKPQTTRTRIMGVLTKDETQLVFTDTPGFHRPKTKLGEKMIKAVSDSIGGVDACLMVVEGLSELRDSEKELIEKFKKQKMPTVLAINKIDLIENKEELMGRIMEMVQEYNFEAIVPVSAAKNDGINELMDELMKLAFPSEHFFPEDTLTDQPERVIASEIIREKMLRLLDKEIPHGVAVSIEKMRERTDTDLMDVEATIYCERESHKGIIIGKQGATLKRISTYARQDMEKFFGCRINLQCWVKVKEDWRNREGLIHNFGLD
ncbi:MAG: GTPase Era [Clostridia bacterium]|nr:GTPase Era [Clostridia bacterium]MBQ1966678.1 GTPase Era [Clostridia bacterium]MBQ1995576.1 GTPase Era [Clostridia bacterium]MBQ5905033.1 GTPase Era [Clostridia bacterium]